jgi:nitrite reductase/ring-hydroxylating ferredoxin subunit
LIFLCRIEDLARTGAKGIVLGEGADTLDVVVVEKDGARHAFINACPHQFIPLETFPDDFFTEDRKHLVCSGHGALFEPDSGRCIEGPCEGEGLDPLAIAEQDGAIYLAEALSPAEIARAKKSKRNW